MNHVNEAFDLMKDFDVSFSTEKGLGIYNHETDDLVITMNSSTTNLKMRVSEYIQKQHNRFDKII